MGTQVAQRRTQPRTEVQLACTLTRRKGGPITGRTLDLGPGGMRVATDRPLAVDEVLRFALPLQGGTCDGDARVLREQAQNVYALRFESLAGDAVHRLVAIAGS